MKKAPATKPLALRTASTALSTPTPLAERRELYLNSVLSYVRVPSIRATVVRYLVKYGFNGVKMYGIDNGLSDATLYGPLSDFIRELRTAGIFRVGLAWSSAATVSRVNAYNDSVPGISKIDSAISEIEPWVSTSGVSWASFLNGLQSMKNWAAIEPKPVETLFYCGWFNKPTGTSEPANVLGAISRVNIGALHVYQFGKPTLGYVLGRLQSVAAQAATLGYNKLDRFKVMLIYSMEQEFSGPYVKASGVSFDQLHGSVVSEYSLASFPNKDAIEIVGYLIFKYSDAILVKP